MKNTKRIIAFLMAAMMVLCLASCGKTEKEPTKADLIDITFCLDWTPNTNHTGLYVAKEKGYYEEAGLNVTIIQPPEDGCVQICSTGEAQFAVKEQDGLAAALLSDTPANVTAVAALIQHNTSGIISKKGAGMESAKGLEGNTYLTWDSPIELAMMKNVVEADGGKWDNVKVIPNTVTDEAQDVNHNPDHAIWVFYGWGAVNAQVNNIDTDFFFFKDINPVFDYYTPAIIANNDFIKENPEVTKAFLEATKKGYEFAIENPEEAAQILIDSDETGALAESADLVIESQKWLASQYKAEVEQWGYIDAARWDAFYAWLWNEGLISREFAPGEGFTNDYFS